MTTIARGAPHFDAGAERTLSNRRRFRLVYSASRRGARFAPLPDRDPQRPASERPEGAEFWTELLAEAITDFGNLAMTLTRDLPLEPSRSALLFIDVQNFSAHREGAEFKNLGAEDFQIKYGWFFKELDARVIPNMATIQTVCRKARVDMYTTIESLTLDGRDRSLDYKITGFHVPKGSWDGKVIDRIAPEGDEIVLPKTSSSVFVSTHIDYILRNLGVRQLAISGLITDQCVESAIRDACDLGYLVTQVTDACLTHSQERHDHSLRAVKGYCRQVSTRQLVAELEDLAMDKAVQAAIDSERVVSPTRDPAGISAIDPKCRTERALNRDNHFWDGIAEESPPFGFGIAWTPRPFAGITRRG